METTIFTNKPLFLGGNSNAPFSSKSIPLHRQHIRPSLPKRSSRATRLTAKRDIYGGDFGGAMVDNDMFLLRKRIHEMKTTETKQEAQQCWMEWEREYYDQYRSDVCAFVGFVHLLLMNSRPSMAISMLVLFMSSVPASVIMGLLHLGGFGH